MRTGISIDVSPVSRARLDAIVADRNSAQKHVWRARIVLLSADGAGTAEIMRTAGVSKTAVWRWQERFMQEGVDGLKRDKTRPLAHPAARARGRRARGQPDPSGPAGLDDPLDGRVYGQARRDQRQFGAALPDDIDNHYNDNEAACNQTKIAGALAAATQIDQRGARRGGLGDRCVGSCSSGGKDGENRPDARKHPKVRAWLDRHLRFTFHVTPTSCSWANAVEGFIAKLSKRRLKRGAFHSVVDLQAAINHCRRH